MKGIRMPFAEFRPSQPSKVRPKQMASLIPTHARHRERITLFLATLGNAIGLAAIIAVVGGLLLLLAAIMGPIR